MRFAWIMVALCAIASVRPASAQQDQSEYLIVENTTSEPISVYIKSRYPKPKDDNWSEPTEIKPGKEAQILLGPNGAGYQPFDIDIRENDSDNAWTDYIFSDIKLCTWMQVCARQGQQNWTLTTERIQDSRRVERGKIVAENRDKKIELPATADRKNVRVKFQLVQAKPDDPIPTPPQPPPKTR